MNNGKVNIISEQTANIHSESWNLVDLFLGIHNRLPNEKDGKPCNDNVKPFELCKEYIKIYDLDEDLLRNNEMWDSKKRAYLYRFAKEYIKNR